ncbi:thioredoxin domain-containing protein [Flavobacterium sp.]|uniref:thioredoxin domain-containing protein n=1 Tax=Flavobacterium sp. TaxID=239 RepID=UPI00378E177F
MKFRHILFLIITFSIFSCNGQPSKNIETIAPEAFAKKIKETPKAQILDVRTPEEFASEHIDNATNINWLGADFMAGVEKLDKSQPVFVYCKSGGRSAKASAKLEELGFKTIIQLDGGMMKWNAAGLSKPSEKIIGICPQEYAELLNTDKKILIDFNAKWCAPCKKMAPYLDQMQKDLADKVVIIRLDADENKTMINELKISELPTLLIYENKELKWKHSGFISEEDLKKQLQ